MPKRLKVSVAETQGTAPSVACYFPSGQQQQQQGPSKYAIFETNTGRAKAYTVIGQKENVEYVGDTRGDEYAPGAHPCNYVMGVLDKASGSLQLLPLSSTRVLRMEPRLPGLQYGAAARAGGDEGEVEESREQRLATNKMLVEAFGSTRRRRQLNAREEGTVRVEKLGDSADALQAYMGKVVTDAEAQGFTKDKIMSQVSAARHLPPHNLEACTAWEAYPWDTLVPGDAAGSIRPGRLLKAAQEYEAEKEMREKRKIDPYVLSRLPLLRDPDQRLVKHKAQVLAYLSALLTLKKAQRFIQIDPLGGGLQKKASDLKMSSELLEALLKAFYHYSHRDGRECYEQDKEREALLVAYICVTALLAEPGASLSPASCSALADALKMPVSDLVVRFREVGATSVPSSIKTEDISTEEKQKGAKPARSYTVTLLPDPRKTLGQSLPAIKLPAKRK
ncbi:RNA polymerase I associated factor, A49-like protein [Dunaliella salina]|uniref:RNA polymerase I associated factor, A49-like protein n=1 Tax=Dunaliella salina TaxID=3046 RepID=A0ABQ7H5R4_DUNSA|nr:RNA polymerase I associated factor, A49-like protein [Dunaliella salina]|eukprot:KAF5842188.1 RNA polymerase I associated factor, A49-like protein [Dunaliella salina]